MRLPITALSLINLTLGFGDRVTLDGDRRGEGAIRYGGMIWLSFTLTFRSSAW